jgi:hypothetical protein
MSFDKGAHVAVRVARRGGRKLVLATKMRVPDARDYFHRAVRPLVAASDDLYIEPPCLPTSARDQPCPGASQIGRPRGIGPRREHTPHRLPCDRRGGLEPMPEPYVPNPSRQAGAQPVDEANRGAD